MCHWFHRITIFYAIGITDNWLFVHNNAVSIILPWSGWSTILDHTMVWHISIIIHFHFSNCILCILPSDNLQIHTYIVLHCGRKLQHHPKSFFLTIILAICFIPRLEKLLSFARLLRYCTLISIWKRRNLELFGELANFTLYY